MIPNYFSHFHFFSFNSLFTKAEGKARNSIHRFHMCARAIKFYETHISFTFYILFRRYLIFKSLNSSSLKDDVLYHSTFSLF